MVVRESGFASGPASRGLHPAGSLRLATFASLGSAAVVRERVAASGHTMKQQPTPPASALQPLMPGDPALNEGPLGSRSPAGSIPGPPERTGRRARIGFLPDILLTRAAVGGMLGWVDDRHYDYNSRRQLTSEVYTEMPRRTTGC